MFADFCDQCQTEIAENIFVPLARAELLCAEHHTRLTKQCLLHAQCGEDVISILVQAGFITQDFAVTVLSQETSYYGQMTQLNEQRKYNQITLEANRQQKANYTIKPVQISSRGCFVKYLR